MTRRLLGKPSLSCYANIVFLLRPVTTRQLLSEMTEQGAASRRETDIFTTCPQRVPSHSVSLFSNRRKLFSVHYKIVFKLPTSTQLEGIKRDVIPSFLS